jgi:uncharacterized membrane protein
MTGQPTPPGLTETLAENIERLTSRRRREIAEAPITGRISDRITAFTGSMTFVLLHLALFGGWIVANLGWTPVKPWDPSFVVLAMIASVEAIFLSTFVLISQNRMAAQADRRADLDLQIGLLTEHELSKLAVLIARMAERMGVHADTPDLREIEENVNPEVVLDAIEANEVKP